MRKLFGLLLKTEQVRLEVIKLFFDRGVRRVLTDPCIEEHQSGSALLGIAFGTSFNSKVYQTKMQIKMDQVFELCL